MIADLLCVSGASAGAAADTSATAGSITGVDISPERLNVARNVLRKYGLLRPKSARHQQAQLNDDRSHAEDCNSGDTVAADDGVPASSTCSWSFPPIRLLQADGCQFVSPPPAIMSYTNDRSDNEIDSRKASSVDAAAVLQLASTATQLHVGGASANVVDVTAGPAAAPNSWRARKLRKKQKAKLARGRADPRGLRIARECCCMVPRVVS